MTEYKLVGDENCQENCGGMKKYQTMAVERSVAGIPPTNPPNWALKNTAGKKRNQTNGEIYGQKNHCTRSAIKGIVIDTAIFLLLTIRDVPIVQTPPLVYAKLSKRI